MTNFPSDYEKNDSEVEEEKAIDKELEKQRPFSETEAGKKLLDRFRDLGIQSDEIINSAFEQGIAQGEQTHHITTQNSELGCAFCEDLFRQGKQAGREEALLNLDRRLIVRHGDGFVHDECENCIEKGRQLEREEIIKKLQKVIGKLWFREIDKNKMLVFIKKLKEKNEAKE